MIHLAPLSTRNDFGILLTRRELLGVAVEVGTHRGEFAAHLLASWPGRCLTCVDPWRSLPGYEEQEARLKHIGGSGDRERDFVAAQAAISIHRDRVTFLRCCSVEAAPRFPDGSLDFVYLDGDHRQEYVRQDLALWWPKLRARGLLAGHDFLCPGEEGGGWGRGIQPEVLEFAQREGRDVFLIVETEGLPWSFYLER